MAEVLVVLRRIDASLSLLLELMTEPEASLVELSGHQQVMGDSGVCVVCGVRHARRALRPCAAPGCHMLVESGRCERHRLRDRRPGARVRGYDADHEQWRKAVLARDPVCRMCGAPGKRGDHADHIVPIRRGGARLDVANGQRLCARCHNSSKQRQEGGGGPDIGRRGTGPLRDSDFSAYRSEATQPEPWYIA